jgi:protein TilB
MVRITEQLIRKRSEHNEGMISTLEELSLHQQDIEKIEYLDKWCRDLRILYLQSNLIPKIENVGRLKKLEYLNLALNNIEKIENLEGCESLTKLDFTVNFIGELTSIESLRSLVHLRELFLTGNPCADYEGYWQYVIATLPQLQFLDGKEIEKSERIRAMQVLHEIRPEILEQQKKYQLKREKEKQEASAHVCSSTEEMQSKGIDKDSAQSDNTDNQPDEDEKEKKFWEEKVAYTPESRLRIHEHLQAKKQKEESKSNVKEVKVEKKLQTDDGRMLNVNDAKVDFTLRDSEDLRSLILDIAVFRHLDTSLCSIDVQPTYVRVYIKGKVFQLVLNEEVQPAICHAQRSQTTGHLVITMPKVNQVITPAVVQPPKTKPSKTVESSANKSEPCERSSVLEVDPSVAKLVNVGDIVSSKDGSSGSGDIPTKLLTSRTCWPSAGQERPNSPEFVDDDSVPPLE